MERGAIWHLALLGKRKKKKNNDDEKRLRRWRITINAIAFSTSFWLLSLWRPRQISWLNCHRPVLRCGSGIADLRLRRVVYGRSFSWLSPRRVPWCQVDLYSKRKKSWIWAQYGTESSRNRKSRAMQNAGYVFFNQWRRCRDKGLHQPS